MTIGLNDVAVCTIGQAGLHIGEGSIGTCRLVHVRSCASAGDAADPVTTRAPYDTSCAEAECGP